MDKSDFFTSTNAIYGITEDDYLNIAYRLESLKAIERLSSQKLYVIDYFKKAFLYVSEVFADFCGFSIEELKEIGFDLYLKCVPKEDLYMLLEINRQQFCILDNFSEEEAEEYKLCCDFRFEYGSHRYMLNHQLTPFAMKDGRVWLALCAVSMSSSKESGNVVIKKGDSSTWFDFNLQGKSWNKREQIELSSMERNVIMLSACGMTVQSISRYLNKSVDAIKSCKRIFFKKLGVDNISEAITFVINHHLW